MFHRPGHPSTADFGRNAMLHFKNGLAGAIVSLALLAGQPAGAQEAATPAKSTKMLETGGIHGELLTFGEDKALTAGSSVFAQIRLSSQVSGKRSASQAAEIIIAAERGDIVAVTGASVKDEDGGAKRARVDGLRKGRDRTVLVEVRLPKAEAAEPTRLKVSLLAVPGNGSKADTPEPAGQQAAAEVSWSVKDCVGGYYGALQQIRENAELKISEKLKVATKADPALPQSWLFSPKPERRSRRLRRSSPDTTAASPTERERAVFAEAGKLVRAGRDPALSTSVDLGWALGKVAGDLDGYLAQPANAAICTGAPGMIGYYDKRLEALPKRGEYLTRLAADAKAVAREKAEAALQTARELSDGAAAWGSLTPVATKAMALGDDGLKGLTLSLAELAALPAEALGKVKDALTPYEALSQVREAGFETDGMPEAVQRAVREALVAIDAAARLEVVQQRHMEMQRAFEGRIKAIRDAHSAHCTCQR
jgi:hypothetical protein